MRNMVIQVLVTPEERMQIRDAQIKWGTRTQSIPTLSSYCRSIILEAQKNEEIEGDPYEIV